MDHEGRADAGDGRDLSHGRAPEAVCAEPRDGRVADAGPRRGILENGLNACSIC